MPAKLQENEAKREVESRHESPKVGLGFNHQSVPGLGLQPGWCWTPLTSLKEWQRVVVCMETQ